MDLVVGKVVVQGGIR